MMKRDVVIVGAGVTGLRIAKLLGDKKPLLVSWDMGGMLGSYEEKGFTFDFGGHVYTTADEVLTGIMKKSGGIKHERKAVYIKQPDAIHVPYPVQDHADLLGISVEPDPLLEHLKPFHNMQGLGNAYFGRRFYNDFFAPFNRRVWCVDPVEMDADWIANRVKLPSEKKESWGPNAEFWYAPSADIINTMVIEANEAGAEIWSGFKVEELNLRKKQIRFKPTKGSKPEMIEYKVLYWTLPIRDLAIKIGISPFAFRSNNILAVGIGLRDILPWDHFNWAYFDVELRPHRMTLLGRYHPKMSPNGKDSLLIEFPYAGPHWPEPDFASKRFFGQPEYAKSIAVHRNVAMRALDEAMIFDIEARYVEVAMMSKTLGYPIPTIGIRNIVAEAKIRLLKDSVFTAGRWGSWGYFNLDHCFADARAAVGASITMCEEEIEEYLYSRFYYG